MNRQQQIEAFLLAAHELIAQRLRAQPNRIAQAVALLQSWREKNGPGRSDPLRDEWQKLLGQPVERVIAVITERSDHAAHLRSVSPMGALITQEERSELLQQSRQLV